MGNPFSWIYDKSGLDSAVGFTGDVVTGNFGEAGKKLGRGGTALWKATPGNELFNITSAFGRGLTGEQSWKDVWNTTKGQSGNLFLDTLNLLPAGKGVGFGVKALFGQPTKKLLGNSLRNFGIGLGFKALDGDAASTQAQTASSGGYGSSAAERRRKEEDDMEYYRSRIDAQKANTIEPFPEVIPPMGAPTTGASGVAGAAPGGLVGLTPDQTYQIAMQDRLLQKQYDELLNQLALQEKQATLDTATSRYGIQREAATSAKDLGAQLAAAGMDFSPASAIGAEQLVQGNRIQQEAAASKNLADILSEIKQAKVKAKSDMDLGKLLNQIDRGRQQVSNTIANVGGYYNRIGGR